MSREIKNTTASVNARLQDKARQLNRPFAELLQHYGMERFLYRLGRSKYKNKFTLKGALMFSVWNIPQRRFTMDMDFLAAWSNRVSDIEKVIKDICVLDVVDDGLAFDAATVAGQKIKEDADYEGVRVKFKGFLGAARIPMQIDVAFGDIVYPKPGIVDYPAILDFPHPRLKGYAIESVVSEKFEAIVKLGSINSRMKDFYDIWLIARRFDFKSKALATALYGTFKARKTELPLSRPLFTEEIYDDNSDRQTLWKAFLKKGNLKNVPEKLSIVAKEIEDFLIVPLKSAV